MKNINLLLGMLISFFPTFLSSQISLGTTTNFALFTAEGAFDNVGESEFVGDIGTNVGAITGFPPGTLTGVIQHENPITLQAAADVEDAYNSLTAIPCDSALSNALGDGQTLTPMVYCVLTAASLSGELILDAENIPGAIFIIKITGVLDVVSHSKVTLINTASISNVYWQIDGALNVYDSATFNGIFLVNGAISVLSGAALNGNGLSRVGAITTFGISSTIPNDSDLPIELVEFQGEGMTTHNRIVWKTASELNNDYFTIERSADGIAFKELVRIYGAGNSSNVNNYMYDDFGFETSINYYRLKQTDYDGGYTISGIISIDNLKGTKSVIRISNMQGQEVDMKFEGLRILQYDNGKILKVSGKYMHSDE